MTEVTGPAIEDLRKLVKSKGSQQAAADELGITPAYINDILKGRRNLSEAMLEKLGYVKVIAHVKTDAVPFVVSAIEMAQQEAAGLNEIKRKVFKGVKQP
jgi:transcriptional regulator with XRE-family HTH domain